MRPGLIVEKTAVGAIYRCSRCRMSVSPNHEPGGTACRDLQEERLRKHSEW